MRLIQNLELIRQDQTKPATRTVPHHWLDRLRSSKGFPTCQNPDLGSFLLTNTDTHSLHTRPYYRTRTHTRTHYSILAQLFNGASFIRTHPYKKCPRKQPHPTKVLPPSPASSTTTTTTTTVIHPLNIAVVVPEEENEQEEVVGGARDDNDITDLKGFSKSEVTVIDTSSSGWKDVKFVYRKQNVWKLGDRKRKLGLLAKKKSSNTPMANEIGFSNISLAEDITSCFAWLDGVQGAKVYIILCWLCQIVHFAIHELRW